MGLLLVVSLVVVGIINLGLGLVIMFGSEKRTLRQVLFSVFSVCVFLWAVGLAMFLATSSAYVATLWATIYYIAAAVIGYTLLTFGLTFIPNLKMRFWLWFLLLPLLGIIWLTLEPGVLIESVKINSGNNGNEVMLGTVPYNAYTVYFLAYMYGALTVVGRLLFKRGVDKELKLQLGYIFTGLVMAGTFGVFFNLLLPFFGNYQLIWVGPLFSVLLVGFIFAAIVRHRLFDIRLVIARTMAYLLLLVTMALVYGLAVFSISTFVLGNQQITMEQNLLYIMLAVFLAFTFQPLKTFFDNITERIFFRHEYNPQDVLIALGNVIADEINLAKISDSALDLLSKALKPEFAVMFLLSHGTKNRSPQQFEVGKVPESIKSLLNDGLTSALKRSPEQILTIQDMIGQTDLQDKLLADKIGLTIRLQTSREFVGYLLFGNKQNGLPFNGKDRRMLATVGDELGLAIQNALRFDEIEHFNSTLKQQVADATVELRESNKQLKALDIVKDEFISMASHQLRTPLTSIKGYISMLLDGDAGKISPEQHKFLEEAFISSQRMVYLVGDFLNVSRIQTGKFVLETRPTNLAEVVADEVERLQMTAQHREVTIEYTKPANFPTLNIDEEKTRQVIMNFIDNAVFYSRQGGQIKIELVAQPHQVRFTVTDHGIGVPDSEKGKLFTKFFRATNARRIRPDGTGIGLFLAKKVVNIQGGQVIGETEENVGSTFGFSLPLNSKPTTT
jgi:signal transduction histidine kinase